MIAEWSVYNLDLNLVRLQRAVIRNPDRVVQEFFECFQSRIRNDEIVRVIGRIFADA